MTGFGVVVLAGGAGRRLGGAAKPTLAVGGTPMLARVLAAVDDADGRVVVGPGSLGLIVSPGVRVIQEEPAGGGPVAALAAGLAELATDPAERGGAQPGGAGPGAADCGANGPGTAECGGTRPGEAGPGTAERGTTGPGAAERGTTGPGAAERGTTASVAAGSGATGPGAGTAGLDAVVVLAADLPLLTREAVETLLLALGDQDGAVFVDDEGRRQWLCGAWRPAALSERLAALAATGPLGGRAMRELVAPLRVVGVPVGGGRRPPWYDCDTPADLADAERRLT